LLFEIGELIYRGQAIAACQRLRIAFLLLPPDIRRDLKKEELEVQAIITAYSKTGIPDPTLHFVTQHKKARRFLPRLREILGNINKLLFDRYLRTGYRGLDLSSAAETLLKGDEKP